MPVSAECNSVFRARMNKVERLAWHVFSMYSEAAKRHPDVPIRDAALMLLDLADKRNAEFWQVASLDCDLTGVPSQEVVTATIRIVILLDKAVNG